jgi:hypothetical protein
LTIQELANTPRAKFEFWVQEKWNVLPTDQRFIDLTEEQLALLFAQYQRVSAPAPNNTSARDGDYPDGASDDPNVNTQKYVDPDFEKEWENLALPTDTEGDEPKDWEEV